MKKAILFLCLAVQIVLPQNFGQNKVQYRDFDWEFIKSPHFDIYYYNDSYDLATFTADVAEEAYEQVSKHLRWILRKPVSIIVYDSHNDFQQTNVTWSYMSEGIGGVTELFKNRVVLPFEGNYEQFRHVIHHELVHAIINDMVYGGSIQSIISGRQRLQIPLWANEGLAEYLSENWDTKADMIIRDIAINEYIPSIMDLNYYMAYKGGQSVWRYIAETYGREKVGEIFIAMKKTQNARKGFKQALGMDFEDLTEKWHKYLKKEYWPDIAGREELDDIAKRLTDHKKKRNYYNISPAISPDGSKIAILTDRSGYADIYLIDAITGKEIRRLVKGNRSINFEELKWLQPGISWSPDGKQIVLAAKSGKQDALHIVDVETGESRSIPLSLDGIFTASWHPDGTLLAFVGNKGPASDIYTYNLKTKELKNLTRDLFSDSEPVWSPDGKRIAFVSDRGPYTDGVRHEETGEKFDGTMSRHHYGQSDIYILDLESNAIERVTRTEYSENYPVWAHTRDLLFYTADYNGIWNLQRYDFATNSAQVVTNVLTGLQQLSLSQDDNVLVFAGYANAGWDIYSLSNPVRLSPQEVVPSQFILKKGLIDNSIVDLRQDQKWNVNSRSKGDYSQYVFSPHYQRYNEGYREQNLEENTLEKDTTRSSRDYVPEPYKTRFTLDMVSGNLSISTLFGAQGMTYFAWSDIMGDHQITFGTEMVLTLENSDYYLSYAYLKHRPNYFFTAFQTADFFSDGYGGIARLRHYGVAVSVSVPFNRFTRFDVGFSHHTIGYQQWAQNPFTGEFQIISKDGFSALLPSASLVFDNSIYGYTGPVDGTRQDFSVTMSPNINKKGVEFKTLTWDYRQYWRLWRDYTFAVRFMVGRSIGETPQKFFLGGVPYWLFGRGETEGEKDDSQYRRVILDSDSETLLEDIYFSRYATPVRGMRYAERSGTNVFLTNLEFRFPFINYLALGFPFKAIFGNIRGHAFFDIGAAWDDPEEFSNNQLLQQKYGTISPQATPTVRGFGLGMKINMGYFLLRIDTAWDVNPGGGYSRPQYYFSLGPDF
ncbi:MAG: peptidase MA family metallohydrolase [Fidelibacterota bacterium]